MTVWMPNARPARRPDESMSLLNDLFAHPLEPGYEELAARRKAAGDSGPTRFTVSPALMIGMLALGLLLTMAALHVRDTASVVSSERLELIDRIETEDQRVNQLQQTLATMESEISGLEDSLLQNSAAGQLLRDQVARLQAEAGSIAVSGPAVVVTLDNAIEHESADEPQLARVLDIDVQQVVNGLWAAGAEAISINGQRITTLTAIRSADNVIKVNYRPMAAPFEIVAVGDSTSLPGRFGDGSGGQWLRHVASNDGLRFSIRSEDSLTIPAGNTPLIYAQPGEVS